MKILVTGAAGFIGYHLVRRLLARGDEVVGLDNIDDYYDVRLKLGRLAQCGITPPPGAAEVPWGRMLSSASEPGYRFVRMNLEDRESMDTLFRRESFDAVCNLAAQAGVRYSLENPSVYAETNIVGFLNVLESCRHHGVNNLSYASSSSVYGLNRHQPYSTHDHVNHPVSLYAASKKSNELMAHTYSHLFGIATTGLRFFTVYGPWGRPDMALFLFTRAALAGEPIKVFNHGEMSRDFTYIDDIVEGLVRVIDNPATINADWDAEAPDPASSSAPYRIYNIGNDNPVPLLAFIEALEQSLGLTIEKDLLPLQPGDVPDTWADASDLVRDMGYQPATPVQEGIDRFVAWYRDFYRV
ncbi:MAG: NAD-dependent epimerase [Pseudomonadota bacterium]